MKKLYFKPLIFIAMLVLSFSVFAACQHEIALNYDKGVVEAFNCVQSTNDTISLSAAKDGQKYSVTVITSATVSEYIISSDFEVESVKNIVGGATAADVLIAEAESKSDLERAYDEALKLSGIAKETVEGFDFDRETYMGEFVFKVEIEDSIAEYTYILKADDMSLMESKVEFKKNQSHDMSSYLTEKTAKAIAFDALGIKESKAKAVTVKSITESGQKIYRVKFEYDGYEYVVNIDAVKGDIIKLSKNILDENATGPAVSENISESEAKDIALAFAFPDGVGNRRIKFGKVKLTYEKGRFIYEVEFYEGNSEYEFEISATDGAIIDVEIDVDEDKAPLGDEFITREDAIKKVLALVDEDALILEVDIDKEKTISGEIRYFYEVEIRVGKREIEYYVDAITGEVTVNDDYAGNLVTPAVTEEQALQKALDSFELTSDKLTLKKIKLEREDGRLCYEIKLYVENIEYSISIDAQNGKILEREIEQDDDVPPQNSNEFITREEAINAVKAIVGANARVDDDVELESLGTGAERRYYYEIEVKVGSREYDYYVDAITGEVRLKGEIVAGEKNYIGEERAISIALKHFDLSESNAKVIKVKLEEDDGSIVYEVKLKYKSREYSVEIDAVSGEILESDISYD